MSTTVAGIEVQRYLEGVRARLGDLPVDERDELLEDLEEHLREVAAEDDGSLEERLGPPAAYADELRVSAGLSSRDARTAIRMIDRVVGSRSVRSLATVIESPQARVARAFLRELEPGWWVLRGYLGILVLGVIVTRDNGLSVRESIPFPLLGSYGLGVVLILAAIWVSVQLGRRAARDKRVWLLSLAATGIVLAAGFTVLGDLGQGNYAYAQDGDSYAAPYLHHADGVAIANICPYSTDGKLLSGVLLFDQRGRAIENTVEQDVRQLPIDKATPTIKNVYPRAAAIDEVEPGAFGPVSCPVSIAAQPQASAPASPLAPGPTAIP